MLEAARYSAFATLRDGRRVEIRALRPDDRAELAAAVARASSESLYRRFFAVRRSFTKSEMIFSSTSISSITSHWSQSWTKAAGW